jgi:hypothetical protein
VTHAAAQLLLLLGWHKHGCVHIFVVWHTACRMQGMAAAVCCRRPDSSSSRFHGGLRREQH